MIGHHDPAGDFDPEAVPLTVKNYTMTLRNATTTTFDEVVIFYKRSGIDGVTFMGIDAFEPGQMYVFPMGAAQGLTSYVVGVFKGGSLAARMPQSGEMTPAKAAQADPFRPNAYTDAWAIEGQAVLPLDQYMYEVSIVNETPDTWDEVAIFFNEKGGVAQGLKRENLPPGGQETFQLVRCDKLDGYVFRIWVGGETVYLDVDAAGNQVDRFPGVGLMNGRRALDYKLDMDACADVWVIGAP